MLRNAVGVGCVSFPGKKRYEGGQFNVISVTRGWVGVKFPGKKRYVTLEWPLSQILTVIHVPQGHIETGANEHKQHEMEEDTNLQNSVIVSVIADSAADQQIEVGTTRITKSVHQQLMQCDQRQPNQCTNN